MTNVVRHAGPVPTTVRIVAGVDGALSVEVVDDGPGAAPGGPGAGFGITGMRERAAATGGTLEAGPREGGGFAVRARWGGAR
ncbi:MAG: hypothetical protein M3Q48_01955 [Actinomycetota bacterium]|nr:hypothetical protein [Actinomycetota bacterium]